MVRRSIVFKHRIGHGVVANETNVFVIFAVFRGVGQEVGDGVVTAAFGVGRNLNRVGAVGGVQDGDGRLLSEEVRAKFTGDLVVRSPHTNLQSVGARGRQDVVDGIVVEPVDGRLTARSVKTHGDDEGRVDGTGDFLYRFVGLGTVEQQLGCFGAVGQHGGDGIVERPVGSGGYGEGHGVSRVGATLAVERVSSGLTCITGVHFVKVFQGVKVTGVDGR